MSLENKIATALVLNHTDILSNRDRTASEWYTTLNDKAQKSQVKYKKTRVAFGKDQRVVINCEIADTEELQIIGLSKHAALDETEGMLFPYPEPKKVSFWMSEVQFPLDMIFVGSDGRITKIVENIDPGTPGSWGMDHISAVIEVNGGFSKKYNVEVGLNVFELLDRQAQLTEFSPETALKLYPDAVQQLSQIWPNVGSIQFYQYMDTLGAAPMESDDPEVYWDGDQWQIFNGGSVQKQAQEVYPRYPRKDINPKMLSPDPRHENRFRDRDVVDQQVKNQPMDPSHRDETWGYDPVKYHDLDPLSEENPAPVRRS